MLPLPPTHVSPVPVPRSSCHLLCCRGAERLGEAVSGQVTALYIGYVHKPPRACSVAVAVPRPDLVPTLPTLGEAKLAGAGTVGSTDPQSPNFSTVNVIF